MSIVPLPVFEADADPHHRSALSDQEIYERLEPPKTIVVRFGVMKLVGEFPHDGKAKPGCGTKLVVRTHRGTELAEMLTTTCENAGCAKSVTRKELLGYIDNSGGRDYPFYKKGRILRVAGLEDLNKQSALDTEKPTHIRTCRQLIEEFGLPMKLVEVEPILGGELLTFYYMSEERVDFREIVRRLAAEFSTRIEMRQVGARDEARLTADYERCGQYCCCKGFLKVLKPVSMKSAKIQKATLDPLKISGRCGRLMCCLRYEDQTYKELRANLPKRNSRVGTAEGPGLVVDTKVLVQLVLVRLDEVGREVAVPVEDLVDPETCPRPGSPEAAAAVTAATPDVLRGMQPEDVAEKVESSTETPPQRRKKRRRRRGRRKGAEETPQAGEMPPVTPSGEPASAEPPPAKPGEDGAAQAAGDAPASGGRRRRRRGRRRGRRGGGGGGGSAGGSGGGGGGGGGGA